MFMRLRNPQAPSPVPAALLAAEESLAYFIRRPDNKPPRELTPLEQMYGYYMPE